MYKNMNNQIGFSYGVVRTRYKIDNPSWILSECYMHLLGVRGSYGDIFVGSWQKQLHII